MAWSSPLRGWNARRSAYPSIFPPLLKKVEEMKKIGAPTEETARALKGMEKRCMVYHGFWESNERKVQGLLRNGLGWRAHTIFLTIASTACVVKGFEIADLHLKLFKSNR